VLTCREFGDFLMEFIDGELEPARHRLFLKHVAGCRNCAAYLDSYRATVALGRRVCSEPDKPVGEAEIPEKLIRSILAGRRNSSAYLWHLIGAVAASPLLFFYFGS
jgi:anti-sigma factor RsiW